MKLSVWVFFGYESDCGDYDWDHYLSSKSILGASLVALVLCHSAALKCHKDKIYLHIFFLSFALQRNLTFQETKRTDFFFFVKRTWSCSQMRGGPASLSVWGTRTRTDTTKDNSVTMVLPQTESRTTAFKGSHTDTNVGLCALLISASMITIHISQRDGYTCGVGKVV